MGRLSSLKPRVGALAPRLGYAPGDERARDRQRAAQQFWRAWYKSPEWRALKRFVHLRDLGTCQCGCGTVIDEPGEMIADHVVPHRGDRARFFDPANVQTLWKPHHDGWKQRLERAAEIKRG
jgi:5-methylcytosine-specific restriction endonuclease McrA